MIAIGIIRERQWAVMPAYLFRKKTTDYTNERHTIKKNFSGDLYGMLFPKETKKKDTNVIYNKKVRTK